MSIKDLFNQSITVYNKASFNRYGREVVGSGTAYKARVQVGSKTRLLPNGTTYIVEAIIYLQSDATVSQGDKITYDSIDYRVHSKVLPTDGQGNTHHLKLEVTKWQSA